MDAPCHSWFCWCLVLDPNFKKLFDVTDKNINKKINCQEEKKRLTGILSQVFAFLWSSVCYFFLNDLEKAVVDQLKKQSYEAFNKQYDII